MLREFEEEKRYKISLELTPSISIDSSYPIIEGTYDEEGLLDGYVVGDPYNVVNDDLRVFVEALDKTGKGLCLIELYPSSYDLANNVFTFENTIYTDDHITSDNYLRLLSGKIYRDHYSGDYFKATSVDATEYNVYDKDDNLIITGIVASDVTHLYNAGDCYWNKDSLNFYKLNTEDNKWYLYTKDADPIYMYVDSRDSSYYEHDVDKDFYSHFDSDGTLIEGDIEWSTIQDLINEGYASAVHQTDSEEYIQTLVDAGYFMKYYLKIYNNIVNKAARDDILVPLDDVVFNIYTLYRRVYDVDSGTLVIADESETDNPFIAYDKTLAGPLTRYIWTNKYQTATSPVTFIKPLDNVRTYLRFMDYTAIETDEETGESHYLHDIMDVYMYSIPFIRWSIVHDANTLSYFLDLFYSQYEFITNTIIGTKLRTVTSIDLKFYNTYGHSRNFLIGENDDYIDTINLTIEFDMWFVNGTDTIQVIPIIRSFIKKNIEIINTSGFNNLYISNLMRKIELEFTYIDHIRFVRINNYPSDYQAVKHCVTDLNDLDVSDRRWYVPEMLVVDPEDIIINDYFV
jgi:hypothetical protein